MKRTSIFIVIWSLAMASCAVPFQGGPNTEQLAAAEYGPAPEDPETIILSWMEENLYDPISAKMEITEPAKKGWWGDTGALLVPRNIHYCWMVKTRILAKNKMGGYIGWKPYHFFFRDGKIEYFQTTT